MEAYRLEQEATKAEYLKRVEAEKLEREVKFADYQKELELRRAEREAEVQKFQVEQEAKYAQVRLDQEKREAEIKADMDLREKEWRATAPTHYTSTVYRSHYSPYAGSYHYVDPRSAPIDPRTAPRYYGMSGSPMRYASPSRTVIEKSPARI